MLPSTRPPLPPGRPVIDKVSKDEEDGSKTNWADYSQSENTDAEDKPTREEEEAETTLNSEKASVDDELYVDIPSPKGDAPTLPPPPSPPSKSDEPPSSQQPETSPARVSSKRVADDDEEYITFATCEMSPALLKEWGIKYGDHWYEIMKSNEIVLSDGQNVPGVEENWIYCLLCDKKFCSFDALKIHLRSSLHEKRISAFRGESSWPGAKHSPRTPRGRSTVADEVTGEASCELPDYVNIDPHGWVCTVCCGHHAGAVLPSSALMEMHLMSDQHNAECVALGIEPFWEVDEDAATLVGQRNAEVMSENCMVTIRYKENPMWVYCAICDARMEGLIPLHRHVDSAGHKSGLEAANTIDRRNGWSWGATAIIDEDGTVMGRRISSATRGKTTANYRNGTDYERDPRWPNCIEDSEFGWECSWCDAQLASSWHVMNHLQGKKHKKAEAYRAYEVESIPSPPSRDPVYVARSEEPISKLPVKKPLRPLKPAGLPPRRPSRSPPRQTFEERVMAFEGSSLSSNPPPPPPPLPVEVTPSARSSGRSRNSMNWQEPAVDIAARTSLPLPRVDPRQDAAYRMATSYSASPNHHYRAHHASPELYNEIPSPTRAYHEEPHNHREDKNNTYGSCYERSGLRPENRERHREYSSPEAYISIDPWKSNGGPEHGLSRGHAARQFEFVTQQCVKIYGYFPPKFITKNCVCESCMVGPGRDLPLDSREGLAWTAAHVYAHLKTRVNLLEMGTCYPVRKVAPRAPVYFSTR